MALLVMAAWERLLDRELWVKLSQLAALWAQVWEQRQEAVQSWEASWEAHLAARLVGCQAQREMPEQAS